MIATVIPSNTIKKIAIYVNTNRKTMSQIKQETGCQYIINGGLFDMNTFKSAGYLTVDGQVISQKANPYGMAIKDNTMVFSYANNVNYPNFLGCYHVLVRDGKVAITQTESNKYGKAYRSCIGLMKNGDVYLYADQTSKTLYDTATLMANSNCWTVLNYDGGGSTQCDFNGKRYTSSRIVHNYLCIWTEDTYKESIPSKEESNTSTKKEILLIAGHGAGDPGACSGSWQEATETRKVVPALAEAMKNIANVTIYDTNRNAYTDYQNGTLNSIAKYDYVLEIHFNVFNGTATGTECYVTTSESGTGVEEAICKNIAECKLTNRGIKRKNFAVINSAKKAGTSSALLEVCFLDNLNDMKVYSENFNNIISAIANGIKQGFGLSGEINIDVDSKPDDNTQEEVNNIPIDEADLAWQWGIDNGITDGTNPDKEATRKQVITMIYRALNIKN